MEEPSVKFLLFEVLLNADLTSKLSGIEANVDTLLRNALQGFLSQHYSDTAVFANSKPCDGIKLYFGVCWHYLNPTKALVEDIKNRVRHYLESLIIDYSGTLGLKLENVTGVSVTFVP